MQISSSTDGAAAAAAAAAAPAAAVSAVSAAPTCECQTQILFWVVSAHTHVALCIKNDALDPHTTRPPAQNLSRLNPTTSTTNRCFPSMIAASSSRCTVAASPQRISSAPASPQRHHPFSVRRLPLSTRRFASTNTHAPSWWVVGCLETHIIAATRPGAARRPLSAARIVRRLRRSSCCQSVSRSCHTGHTSTACDPRDPLDGPQPARALHDGTADSIAGLGCTRAKINGQAMISLQRSRQPLLTAITSLPQV